MGILQRRSNTAWFRCPLALLTCATGCGGRSHDKKTRVMDGSRRQASKESSGGKVKVRCTFVKVSTLGRSEKTEEDGAPALVRSVLHPVTTTLQVERNTAFTLI